MVLEDMDRPVKGPTPILGDNQAARDIIVNPGATSRTRYFERATMLVKRLYMLLIVVPYLIGTWFMTADIFTKPLDRATFERHRDRLTNRSNGNTGLTVVDNEGSKVSLKGKAARLWSKLVSSACANE